MRWSRRTWLAALASVAACRRGDRDRLRVFAAASLTEVIAEIATLYATEAGVTAPETIFEGTSKLAAQLRAGASADVFISADRRWMDTLADEGFIEADTRVDLLGNRLVVVVPRDAPTTPADTAALASLERLALAGPEVPAGKYARAALEHLHVTPRAIVDGDDVRTALAWVARGEVPAGIVYATDAAVEPAVRVAFELPATSHPPIVYPAAVLRRAHDPAGARAFVAWCQGDVATQRFRAAGFTQP